MDRFITLKNIHRLECTSSLEVTVKLREIQKDIVDNLQS